MYHELGDDCYALKGGRDKDGLRIGKPTENAIIRYCIAKAGHGGVTIEAKLREVLKIYMPMDVSLTELRLGYVLRPGDRVPVFLRICSMRISG